MSFRNTLSQMWTNVQLTLFPMLQKKCGELSKEHKNLVSILELIRIEEFIPSTKFHFGRPCKDRPAISRAFIAKMVLKIPNTKQLIRLLKVDNTLKIICGWEEINSLPSESKFSRVFNEFANSSLPDKVHQALIKEVYKDTIIGHLIKDSAPLESYEKPLEKLPLNERKKIKNDRQKRERNGELNRRQIQLQQNVDQMISDLPKACDIGRKRSSKGCGMSWKGYKLHAAVDDHCIPIAVIVTSASVNDCEVAIPLGAKANRVAKNYYDLMDAAYDVPEIKEHSLSMGHVPIIDKCARNKAQKIEKEKERQANKLLNFSTAERTRYKQRFPKERFNALYLDSYGGRNLLYSSYMKNCCHVMFGILAMTGSMLIKLL